MEEYAIESVIRRHHVYKTIGHLVLGEQLILQREEGNSPNRHAVSVMSKDDILGHVPREPSRIYWYFISFIRY